jgi:hypothetical protein
MAFTLAVIVNVVAIAQKKYTNSMGLLAVIPLALLFSRVCTCSCCRMPPNGAAGNRAIEGADWTGSFWTKDLHLGEQKAQSCELAL